MVFASREGDPDVVLAITSQEVQSILCNGVNMCGRSKVGTEVHTVPYVIVRYERKTLTTICVHIHKLAHLVNQYK